MYTRHPLEYLYKNKLNYENAIKLNNRVINTTPRLKKVTISFSSINLKNNYLEDFLGILELLTKQKPNILRSKKPVIHMKIRENQVMGFKVTLRRHLMFDFLLKFFGIINPRYPFFQGYTFGYNKGNVSFLYDKLSFFHELDLDPEYVNNPTIFPNLNITLRTTAKSKYETLVFLRNLQIPCFKLN